MMSGNGGATLIKPPNNLASKVTVGGPGAVDEAALKRAEDVIADMTDSYLETVRKDLDRIQKAFADLAAGKGKQRATLESIFEVAHDIKGQGGSFDYNLMTVIGNQLCLFIDGLDEEAEEQDIEVIKLHVDALQVVIAQQLKGDGGKMGTQLLSGLEGVISKRSRGKPA